MFIAGGQGSQGLWWLLRPTVLVASAMIRISSSPAPSAIPTKTTDAIIILSSSIVNYISLGTLMCLEKSIISPVGIYDSNKALEVLCSVSRAKVLNLMGDIIKVVFRDGCRTPPLDNVCCFSVLSVFSSLSDDLVPPMAALLKTMPNLIDLQLSSAVISVNSRTSSSGFNISYWKSLNLAFVDRLQNATLSILNGNNEVELAAYLLENATNLKKMVIYHSGQHSAISETLTLIRFAAAANFHRNQPPQARKSQFVMADNRNGNGKPTKGAGAGNNPYAIDLNVFSQRLKALYSHWNEHPELWDSCEVIAIATPPQSDEIRYLKSSTLQMWMVGYDVPDTIMVFMKKQIHFLGSQKKVSFFQGVKKAAKEAVGVDLVTHVKAKSDDGGALMDAVLGVIHAQLKADGHDTVVVGRMAREEPEGNLLKLWFEKLKSATVQLGDVTNGLSDLFAVKEKEELDDVKKAAYLSSVVMQKMVTKLENVIDDE
ncbi:hypothetical protein ACLB2K_065076 [Fragaria x ananassa]